MSMSKFVQPMEDEDVLDELQRLFSFEAAEALKSHLEDIADCMDNKVYEFNMDEIARCFEEESFECFVSNYDSYSFTEPLIPEGFDLSTATDEEIREVAIAMANAMSDYTTVLYLSDGFVINTVF